MRYLLTTAILTLPFFVHAKESIVVGVSADPQEVAKAIQLADDRDKEELQQLCKYLNGENVFYFAWTNLHKRRPELVNRSLSAIVRSENNKEAYRIRASAAMIFLGITDCEADTIAFLERSPATALELLKQLSDSSFESELPPRLRDSVRKLLNSPNPDVSEEAAYCLAKTDSNLEILEVYFPRARPRARHYLAGKLAKLGRNREVLEILKTERNSFYLEQFIRASTGELRKEALEVLRALAQKSDPISINALIPYAEERDLPLLESELDSSLEIAEVIIRLRKDTREKYLSELRLEKTEKVRSAALVLGELGRGTRDTQLVDALKQALEKIGSSAEFPVAEALAKIGGEPAEALIKELHEKFNAYDKFVLNWTLSGLTPEMAWNKLNKHGLSKPASALSVEKLQREWGRITPFLALVEGLESSGKAMNFDTETSDVPNRHDELIEQFGTRSGGNFKPEAVHETFVEGEDGQDDSYVVQFVHAKKLYRFKARSLGDWYDVEAVVSAIHHALADAGVKERFHGLQTNGQNAVLVFALPETFQAAAAELALPVLPPSSLDQSRQDGVAFEKKAIAAINHAPLYMPNEALAKIIGETPLNFEDATKKFWKYIETNKLLDPKNTMMINADEPLKPLYKSERFTIFKINEIIRTNATLMKEK